MAEPDAVEPRGDEPLDQVVDREVRRRRREHPLAARRRRAGSPPRGRSSCRSRADRGRARGPLRAPPGRRRARCSALSPCGEGGPAARAAEAQRRARERRVPAPPSLLLAEPRDRRSRAGPRSRERAPGSGPRAPRPPTRAAARRTRRRRAAAPPRDDARRARRAAPRARSLTRTSAADADPSPRQRPAAAAVGDERPPGEHPLRLRLHVGERDAAPLLLDDREPPPRLLEAHPLLLALRSEERGEPGEVVREIQASRIFGPPCRRVGPLVRRAVLREQAGARAPARARRRARAGPVPRGAADARRSSRRSLAKLGVPPHAVARRDADEYQALRLSRPHARATSSSARSRSTRGSSSGRSSSPGERAVVARPPERAARAPEPDAGGATRGSRTTRVTARSRRADPRRSAGTAGGGTWPPPPPGGERMVQRPWAQPDLARGWPPARAIPAAVDERAARSLLGFAEAARGVAAFGAAPEARAASSAPRRGARSRTGSPR